MDNTTKTKMWVGALGATLTAGVTALASVQGALDGGLTAGDWGLVATAVATLAGTVYGIWSAPYQRP